ncbi:MAG: GlxA family transcriptional regulator [Rhodobacteraceae bacterium]|nr:GlxA family transcriptional regulator [Paracoccaceae bacterium]
MPSWKNSHQKTQHITVLLFDGFSNLCLANVLEPLRAANMLSGQSLYEWRFASLDGVSVQSSSGLPIVPQGPLIDETGDALLVMPSYGFLDHCGWRVLAALRAAVRRHDVIIGLDTGSWLMAEAGLLDGYRATVHWEELESFSERFPQVATERSRFVIDRDRISCAGAMAAFDLALWMIGERQGQALRLEVETLFRAGERPSGTPKVGRLVSRALALMQENLEVPLTIADLARRLGRSQKELEARMNAELGATPQTVYRRQRLNLAYKLVSETRMSVSEVSVRCGYQSASAMTRAFRSEFGRNPRDLRRG